MNNIAKNSTSKSNNNPEVLKKTKIRKSTECTGFSDRITISPEIIARLEKIKNKTSSIYFVNFY